MAKLISFGKVRSEAIVDNYVAKKEAEQKEPVRPAAKLKDQAKSVKPKSKGQVWK